MAVLWLVEELKINGLLFYYVSFSVVLARIVFTKEKLELVLFGFALEASVLLAGLLISLFCFSNQIHIMYKR